MNQEYLKYQNFFLFVVSEVSTGRRCLSLALFLLALEKKLAVKKPIKNPLNNFGGFF